MFQKIRISGEGTTPLLMHNVRLADPLDPHTKALAAAVATSKKSKTEETILATQKAEWMGGIYHDDVLGVYMPSTWLLKSLQRGGVIYGKKGTAVLEGVLLEDLQIPLAFPDRGKTLEELWADPRYRDVQAVGVQGKKVMRTRPRFNTWGFSADALIETEILDLDVFEDIAHKAARLSGVGDGRKIQMGRFDVKVEVL